MDIKNNFQLSKVSLEKINEILNSNIGISTETKKKSSEIDECVTCWGGSCANGITG